METPTIASVLLDDAIQEPLDYSVPEEWQTQIAVGMRVEVPLKTSTRRGTIIGFKEKSAFSKLASLSKILHEAPFIQEDLLKLAFWMSEYYVCSIRKIFKTLLPTSIRGKIKHKEQFFVKALLSQNALAAHCETLRKKHPEQANVLDELLKNPKGLFLSALLEACSRSSVNALAKKKIVSLEKVAIDRVLFSSENYFKTKPKILSCEQKEALDAIKQDLSSNLFKPRLLYGVTGSGKTEVYFQAIEHALSLGKKVLFLVPEIALTSQTIERLYSRFEHRVGLLHHRLSPGEKHDTWHHILKGNIPIVVGARSSLFVPLHNLGLIIIDEEHDSSYKQTEEAPTYHARDVALMRAKLLKATVIMGSATPSLETYTHALSGKYALSKLLNRPTSFSLPQMTLVDMKLEVEKQKGFTLFSDLLLEKIKSRIKKGEQSLLFLNRRGYHSSQVCTSCGHTILCPSCDLSLTYHLSAKTLSCHLCGYTLSPIPKICPSCNAPEQLKFKGYGTELVEASLHALLPEVRTLRLDRDTTLHKGSHDQIFKAFKAGKADVLIGTQMIAKGLHFPAVTLVGILNADSPLQIPDFRASENLFQLTTQVAGRAGRGDLPGEVLIQTFLKDHPAILLSLSQDFALFYQEEMKIRETFEYPPFCFLIRLIATGPHLENTHNYLTHVRNALIEILPKTTEILPIIPCGYAKIKDKFRLQCLIKSKTRLSPLLSKNLHPIPKPKEISLLIDVDPLSTFF